MNDVNVTYIRTYGQDGQTSGQKERRGSRNIMLDMRCLAQLCTVCSSVIGTVEKRGCLEAKGWMYKKSMFNQLFIQNFIVILL